MGGCAMKLVCPNCMFSVTVDSDDATGTCPCGKDPKSRFTRLTVMVPIDQLTEAAIKVTA